MHGAGGSASTPAGLFPPLPGIGNPKLSLGGMEQRGPHPELKSPRESMLALGRGRGQGQSQGCWVVPGEGDSDYLGVTPRLGPPASCQIYIYIFFFLSFWKLWSMGSFKGGWVLGPFSISRLWVASRSLGSHGGGGPNPTETLWEGGRAGEDASREGVTLSPLSPLSPAARRAPARTGASAAWWAKQGRPCPPRALVAPRTLRRARCPPCPCPGGLLR